MQKFLKPMRKFLNWTNGNLKSEIRHFKSDLRRPVQFTISDFGFEISVRPISRLFARGIAAAACFSFLFTISVYAQNVPDFSGVYYPVQQGRGAAPPPAAGAQGQR